LRPTQIREFEMTPFFLIVFVTYIFFLVLIFYGIVRLTNDRKNSFKCVSCRTVVTGNANFCPNCGIDIRSQERVQPEKNPNRPLVVALCLAVVAFFLIAASFFITGFLFLSPSSGMSTSKSGRDWRIELRKHSMTDEYYFTARDTDDFIVYSSEISKGKFTLELYDAATGQIIKPLAINTTDTLKNLQIDKRYKVLIKADKATGKFTFSDRNSHIW